MNGGRRETIPQSFRIQIFTFGHLPPPATLTPASPLGGACSLIGALVFRVTWDARPLDWLLAEFRLLVNESIRIALSEDIRSRARLTRAAYKNLSERYAVYTPISPTGTHRRSIGAARVKELPRPA